MLAFQSCRSESISNMGQADMPILVCGGNPWSAASSAVVNGVCLAVTTYQSVTVPGITPKWAAAARIEDPASSCPSAR